MPDNAAAHLAALQESPPVLLCPLLSTLVPTADGKMKPVMARCREDACGFWDDASGQCSVVSLAQSFTTMTHPDMEDEDEDEDEDIEFDEGDGDLPVEPDAPDEPNIDTPEADEPENANSDESDAQEPEATFTEADETAEAESEEPQEVLADGK